MKLIWNACVVNHRDIVSYLIKFMCIVWRKLHRRYGGVWSRDRSGVRPGEGRGGRSGRGQVADVTGSLQTCGRCSAARRHAPSTRTLPLYLYRPTPYGGAAESTLFRIWPIADLSRTRIFTSIVIYRAIILYKNLARRLPAYFPATRTI